MNTKNVAIIGYGWVGKAMQKLFPKSYVFDVNIYGTTKKEVNTKDIAFVCVPTPNKEDGSLDTSIVEEVVAWCECELIVIRSTVMPGTCEFLSNKYNKVIVYQPEYLGETPAHPLLDPNTRPFLIIGAKDKKDSRKLIDLYTTVYNANISIRQTTLYEAEVIKITENRAIAFKVAQCQELYDVCQKANIDYYTIRDAVYGDDPRFNLWFTFIYPENRGMKSKCIPKDVYGWKSWAESLGYDPKITTVLLEKNKEWIA